MAVHVQVLDRKRHRVRRLTVRDFTIFKDGQPRDIQAFSEVYLAQSPAATRRVVDARGARIGKSSASEVTAAQLEKGMAINDDDPNSSRYDKTNGFAGSDRQEAWNEGGPQGAPVSEIEKKLMSAAEELGTWLGTAERKTTEFLGQQKSIADQLVRIRDTAARLLAQIEKGRERSR